MELIDFTKGAKPAGPPAPVAPAPAK
jgi:hypothetical protein